MRNEDKQQVEDCVKIWFKEHRGDFRAETEGHSGILIWAKPGTSIYSATYIIHGRSLCVIGDIGDAVYEWSQKITWDFLAGCDLGYFMGKCQASPVGRPFVQWSTRKLESEIRHLLTESHPELSKDDFEDIISGVKACGSSHEWIEFAEQHQDVFGCDYCEMGDWGECHNCHGIGHWVGLQLATGKKDRLFENYGIAP